jgi:hypothetical protein
MICCCCGVADCPHGPAAGGREQGVLLPLAGLQGNRRQGYPRVLVLHVLHYLSINSIYFLPTAGIDSISLLSNRYGTPFFKIFYHRTKNAFRSSLLRRSGPLL